MVVALLPEAVDQRFEVNTRGKSGSSLNLDANEMFVHPNGKTICERFHITERRQKLRSENIFIPMRWAARILHFVAIPVRHEQFALEFAVKQALHPSC